MKRVLKRLLSMIPVLLGVMLLIEKTLGLQTVV